MLQNCRNRKWRRGNESRELGSMVCLGRCDVFDGLDISSNGGRRVGGNRGQRGEAFLGVGGSRPYLVWLLPVLPPNSNLPFFLPHINPLITSQLGLGAKRRDVQVITIMHVWLHLLFGNFFIQDREPQSLAVCLVCLPVPQFVWRNCSLFLQCFCSSGEELV